jgi:hypothetical protein
MRYLIIFDNDAGEDATLAIATRETFGTFEEAQKYIDRRPEIAFRNPKIVLSPFYTVASLNPRWAKP